MSADALLAMYERVADAPDAVAKLRRFVLELAVRGKLVAQDESEQLGANIVTAALSEQDTPFEIPSSWRWVNVVAVGKTRLGKMLDKAKNKGTPRKYLRNTNVRWFDFDLSDLNKMKFEDSELAEFSLKSGDVLICEGGEPGRAAVWDERESDVYFQKAIHRVRFSDSVSAQYFVNSLKASADDGRLSTYFTGTGIKHFTGKGLDSYLFPLPPLAEQHRIVAKVDDMMALCDRLAAERAKRETTRDRLAAASLARLSAPEPDTFHADARFALDALPALSARPDQIKQLRQTILNLAVRGKLVPQDPKDEPAALLLARTAKAKVDLLETTGDSRIKIEATPDADDLPIALPGQWAHESFENLFLFIDYRGVTPPKTSAGIPLITAKNVRMGRLNREPREFIAQRTFNSWMKRGLPRPGDLFFTTEAPLGNVCVNDLDEPFALAQRVVCLQPYGPMSSAFFMFALMSDAMQQSVLNKATGMTAKGIKTANLKPLPIPVPPLAEQYRIVAKVDELLSLCDQLEASLTSGEATRARLLDALLHDALSSPTTIAA